jgi:hypothetical protein
VRTVSVVLGSRARKFSQTWRLTISILVQSFLGLSYPAIVVMEFAIMQLNGGWPRLDGVSLGGWMMDSRLFPSSLTFLCSST